MLIGCHTVHCLSLCTYNRPAGLVDRFATDLGSAGTWGATWAGGERDCAATYSQPVAVSSALSQFIQNATLQQSGELVEGNWVVRGRGM